MTGVPDHDGPVREQLSALRSMLVLAMLLTQQDRQDSILHYVANAVESLGSCTTEGIFLHGQWQEVRIPGRKAPSLSAVVDAAEGGPVTLADVPWSWAYSLSSRHGPAGYVVVGAAAPPAESERFLLRVLAQQAGAALTNARLHSREREQAEELRLANFALVRSMEIHDRLTKVALLGEGQAGIVQAVYELTDRPTAIEDRFGNLLAWAGPDRPDPYPKADPAQQDRLLDRAMSAAGPVREGERLLSVAALGGSPVAVLVLQDPAGTAAGTERMAVEHATTVLTMEIARLQHLAQGEARTRINLVLDLVGDAGAEPATLLNRAQALGYDLVRPHRVVVVEAAGAHRDDDIDMFFHAVGRAARAAGVGSLLAPRLHDVIVLADAEVRWDLFWARVVTEMHGGRCRIGVGGRVLELDGFPHSCQEAELALRIQKTAGGPERITVFDNLGIYKILATAGDTSAMEHFVTEWLGALIDYDAEHGTPLVLTLSEYLDSGGSYDASAKALSVHRSTLKYRLKRIRQVSGHDLGLPDVQFNLQVATRAWRTLQALRES
ncbi:MAG TPA: helix-turn-helix domain-containing protein [Streptosporangiaceae bacterium]|nr:helix-turn-helix domain-containing protein [Streptosporangiaceae bacterium]